MIKMPKKGGVGLRESLQNMAKVIKKVYDGADLSEVSDYIYKQSERNYLKKEIKTYEKYIYSFTKISLI